jgi:hypothetical protein
MPMNRKGLIIAALLPLAACATAPGDDAPSGCPPGRDWRAWIDAMPGPGAQPRLIVSGQVDIPAGMTATLRPGPLDRMMPPGQRFTLELAPGGGPSGPQQVRGEVKPALPQYREVIVTCGGEAIGRVDGSAIETAH